MVGGGRAARDAGLAEAGRSPDERREAALPGALVRHGGAPRPGPASASRRRLPGPTAARLAYPRGPARDRTPRRGPRAREEPVEELRSRRGP